MALNTIGQEKVERVFDKTLDSQLENIIEELEVPNSETLEKDFVDPLVGKIRTWFERSESARRTIEERWLSNLRQYKGVYDDETVARISLNRCRAYIPYTKTKVRTLDSRLGDLLFPANGDKNWSIEPTPVPEYPKEYIDVLRQMYLEQSGQELTTEQLNVLLSEDAKNQAKKMTQVIEDQLSELNWRSVMSSVLHSGHLYGTGCVKGPLVTVRSGVQYSQTTDRSGKDIWEVQEFDDVTPFIESVRIWDLFPDMDAVSLSDARYIIQRRKMDKHELLVLAQRSDFDADSILEYLDRYPDGSYDKKPFETSLQSLGDVVTDSATANDSKKYEVLEYWGYMDAKDLEEVGVSIPSSKRKSAVELACNIWVLGDVVIKAALSPLEGVKWPYHFYYYDKDETSIFGEGIPDVMKDLQDLINSSFRAMQDNMAITAGPQVEADMRLLSPDEDPREIYPYKVWVRSAENDLDFSSQPAVRFSNIESHAGQFQGIIELLMKYCDEVTSIPKYMSGEYSPGLTRTASSFSMLMGSANISLKDLVKNYDDGITQPLIEAMYHWNMQFNTDESIKGDYAIVAKGSSSLMAKEVRIQALNSFLELTSNPSDVAITKRSAIIRAVAEELDLESDGLVKSEDEIAAEQQQAQAQAEAERNWMNNMVETARQAGLSPQALVDFLRAEMQRQAAPAQTEITESTGY